MATRSIKSKVKRALAVLAGLLVVGGLSLVIYVQLMWDRVYDVPYPELRASTDPEVIARGRYLVHGPAHCSNCHVASLDELTRADAGEDLPLRGGVELDVGGLGTLVPANLTPDPLTGIGRYDDGALFRMLRHSIKPDGTASPSLIMPFQHMADEDHVAIVSYLRSLDPVQHETPPTDWTFIGRAVRVFLPPFQPVLEPDYPDHAPPMAPTVERGEYLARYVANCYACHTILDMTTFERVGPEWGGGAEFPPELPDADPDVWLHSPNLTSGPTGVLQNYPTATAWIARFREGRRVPGSPMHWGPFSRMSDEDLEAIYLFLQSVPPVDVDPGPIAFRKE